MNNIDLSDLNPEQKAAVLSVDKPLLILAGAGSGKTRVITYRIAYLIGQGVPARQILALTFTNKAAKEMRERVYSILKNKARGITVATFHSLCVRFLRRHIDLLGYGRDFVIFDKASQLSALKTLFEDNDIDAEKYKIKSVYNTIMKTKGEGGKPEDFLNQRRNEWAHTVGLIFRDYNKILKGYNAVDFEDILYLTIELFDRFASETAPLLERYEYLMVDEYQDTNRVQYRLLKHLTKNTDKLCAVGDDDQSIYGWRGADIRNILDFKKDFPNTKIVKLERNYRSTNIILKAANQVISNNKSRMAKKLWTNIEDDSLIRWTFGRKPSEELEDVASHAEYYKQSAGTSWSNFAFLYRSNYQSRAIEEQLRLKRIPYQVIGGTKFFDRKEIQDCLAYMKFFHNPNDEVSLLRIVNYPRRNIGAQTVMTLTGERVKRGLSLFEMMKAADTVPGLKPRALNSVKSFVELTEEFLKKLREQPFYQVFRELFSRVKLKEEIERLEKTPQIREARVNNYLEFINSLFLFGNKERKGENGRESSLIDFLDYVSLFTDTDDFEEDSGKVSLLTVHSAKGLEFDYVALTGLADGQFPNQRSMHEEGGLEEERRLFYVAVTRAKKMLSLSSCKGRMLYGEWVENEISRFVHEISPELFNNPPGGEIEAEEVELRRLQAREAFFEKIKNW